MGKVQPFLSFFPCNALPCIINCQTMAIWQFISLSRGVGSRVRTEKRRNYSLLFSCIFAPLDIYASCDANTNVICFRFFCCVFRHGRNLHFMVRFNFFLLLFPAYVCKMHLWLFRESTFWWHAARSECFFLSCAFSLVEKEHRKRAYAMATSARGAKNHIAIQHILQRTAAGHCEWEKRPGLSSQECMHGKNNIYGNN